MKDVVIKNIDFRPSCLKTRETKEYVAVGDILNDLCLVSLKKIIVISLKNSLNENLTL